MSFGRFPGFDDDPFFSRDMPSFSMGFPSFPMLGFPDHNQHRERAQRSDQQLALMGPFSMFHNMDKMMSDAVRQQEQAARGGSFYSSSSVMQYSSSADKDGNPQVYHATSSVTKGPGGVKETRKTEADSRTGMKKMAIGHHIDDRSHTIEKRQNLRTKDLEQHQEYINIDESDAHNFDQEWQKRTRQFRHQPSLRDDYSNRRGLGGSGDLSGPSRGHREHRDHRSRSPEKKRPPTHHQPHHHQPPPLYADSEAERRQQYIKKSKRDRQVKF